MSKGTVHVEDRDGARRITIDRPPVNALSSDEYDALAGALTFPPGDAESAPGVRVVLLRARGSTFSAGQDLRELRALDSPQRRADHLEQATRAVAATSRCPVPVVTALQGPAAGAAALLVAVSDRVVAAEGTWLSFPEGRLGLELGASLLGFLPPAIAHAALASGERLPAERLHSWGAIADLVAADAVEERAEQRLDELLALPASTLTWLRASAAPEPRTRAYEEEVRVVVDRWRSLR